MAWYENDGKGGFTKRAIHDDQAAYDIRLVDMDMDGDLDVLVAARIRATWFGTRTGSREPEPRERADRHRPISATIARYPTMVSHAATATVAGGAG